MREQYDALARATGRQRQVLALEALRKYLDVEAWQIAEIHEAIARADHDEFASDERVTAVRDKFRAIAQS